MTANDVLDFLKSHPNRHFTSAVIASNFNVTTQTMNMTLAQLSTQINNEVNGKRRMYWYESEDVKKQKQEREAYLLEQSNKRKKIYVMPKSLSEAYDKAREGRDPNFGYVTIS